jgi:WS/DGAT/MGAT family acyltransferase
VNDTQQPLSNEQAWAEAPQWGTERAMSELEALMWRSERHPRLSSTAVMVELLDTVPDWDRLRAAHEWASRLVPRFRQRVVEPALPVTPPVWATDPDFDLDYHLRRVVLPAPGDIDALLTLVQTLAVTPFDRTRPPWEAMLVEGFDGDRAAYLLKVHHSLTDGMGGIQLMSHLHSRVREPSPHKPDPDPPAPERPNRLGLAAHGLLEQARSAPLVGARRLLDFTTVALRQPGRMAAEAVRLAGSLPRMLDGPPASPSPLLQPRSGKAWRFGILECGLDELKAAGRVGGGTVNDAFIAALLGGLRRYHERFGVGVGELPMAMPVSLRRSGDAMGGNRFTGALLAAPAGVADPADRIAAIHRAVLTARAEPALELLGLAAPVLARVPSAVAALAFGGVGASADLSASNVPGIPHPVYLAGARIDRMFVFGPLPGVAVMAGLVSHVGTCCIGINCDGAVFADPGLLMTCLREGLDEVLALAKPRAGKHG